MISKNALAQSAGTAQNSNMMLSSENIDMKKGEIAKNEKFTSSQRIPLNERHMNINSNTNNVFMNQTYQKSKTDLSFEIKPLKSQLTTDNNAMSVDEQFEIKKAAEKRSYNIASQETEIDPDIKRYIRTCIENETNQIKQFIHEEINTLHVDIIRQFEIQQRDMMESIREFSMLNTKMTQEIERLKKENEELKSKYF